LLPWLDPKLVVTYIPGQEVKGFCDTPLLAFDTFDSALHATFIEWPNAEIWRAKTGCTIPCGVVCHNPKNGNIVEWWNALRSSRMNYSNRIYEIDLAPLGTIACDGITLMERVVDIYLMCSTDPPNQFNPITEYCSS